MANDATLPAAPKIGDMVRFAFIDVGVFPKANTGQKIRIGTLLSSDGGRAVFPGRVSKQTLCLVFAPLASGDTWVALNKPHATWTVT